MSVGNGGCSFSLGWASIKDVGRWLRLKRFAVGPLALTGEDMPEPLASPFSSSSSSSRTASICICISRARSSAISRARSNAPASTSLSVAAFGRTWTHDAGKMPMRTDGSTFGYAVGVWTDGISIGRLTPWTTYLYGQQ